MKKHWLILAALAILCLTLSGCGAKKVPQRQEKAFLSYMKQKYNEEFEIEKIEYERQSTHDPVIPFPSFLEPYSADIRAVLKKKDVDKKDGTEQNIRVYYQHETGTFTDTYQEEVIKENLLFLVLDEKLRMIEQLEYDSAFYSYDDMEVLYPQGIEGYYDVEKNSEKYAYEYLREHKVSLVLSPGRLNVVCTRGETDEIIKKFDKIFMEIFRGESHNVSIWFYDPKDKETAGEDASPFMFVDYRDGKSTVM